METTEEERVEQECIVETVFEVKSLQTHPPRSVVPIYDKRWDGEVYIKEYTSYRVVLKFKTINVLHPLYPVKKRNRNSW